MIEISEAIKIIWEHIPDPKIERVPLSEASGRNLADQVLSPVDHPVFDQSAVDGYAFQYEDYLQMQEDPGHHLSVVGEVPAGAPPVLKISSGQAARIFTGAGVPEGADTVVMQEYTVRNGAEVFVNDPGLRPGGNIRKKGDQIRSGQVALQKGDPLNAVALGFLASLGMKEVAVGAAPKIRIMVTGDEFAETPEDILQGKIFESNGVMLMAQLSKMGLESRYQTQVDDLAEMTRNIGTLLENGTDLMLITGGVSVGDYDFTRPALEANGFEILFHKIAQKPGKPILFGKKGKQFVFGLPGNPRSVMIGFIEYVAPFIKGMMGDANPFPAWTWGEITHDFRRKPGRAAFLAARVDEEGVSILGGQGSHMLQSLSLANGIALIDKDQGELRAGEKIKFHFLDL